MASIRSDAKDASIDMQRDIFGHHLTLRSRDLRSGESEFDFDLQGPANACFDASRRTKHGKMQIVAHAFKNYSRKTWLFDAVDGTSEVNS